SLHNFVVQTNLNVNPALSSVPVSGHIEVTYRQLGNSIDLANSQLNLPHTHLALSGRVDDNLQTILDTTNFDDLRPLQELVDKRLPAGLPNLLTGGNAHFDGAIAGPFDRPHITGNVSLNRFSVAGETWDQVH